MDSLCINGKLYMKLSLIGRGGSSEVYEVVSLESRAVMAVKIVKLSGVDEQMIVGYKNEIAILQRLQGTDHVITLHDFEETPGELRLVMERGGRDLAFVLKSARSQPSRFLCRFTVQHHWRGMLLAVQAIHEKGIIHSDLKPANFILVEDGLKLIDFGIASSIQNDMTSVLKDSQAGTFNYMSPESLNDVHAGPIINGLAGDKPVIKIGTKSDVWSLGCILYNLVYGKTPFQHITNTWQKLQAISNPDTIIQFPPCDDKNLLDVMRSCLQYQPYKRPTIQQLLEHPYLTGVTTSKPHT
ncbi:dual specificity protein kinase TTK isoform X2 [Hyalella azteca]|nr:dual specificity protein kinase TTK isoform X2 [Hyalella azteca]